MRYIALLNVVREKLCLFCNTRSNVFVYGPSDVMPSDTKRGYDPVSQDVLCVSGKLPLRSATTFQMGWMEEGSKRAMPSCSRPFCDACCKNCRRTEAMQQGINQVLLNHVKGTTYILQDLLRVVRHICHPTFDHYECRRVCVLHVRQTFPHFCIQRCLLQRRSPLVTNYSPGI